MKTHHNTRRLIFATAWIIQGIGNFIVFETVMRLNHRLSSGGIMLGDTAEDSSAIHHNPEIGFYVLALGIGLALLFLALEHLDLKDK